MKRNKKLNRIVKQDSPFCKGMQYLTSKGMQYLSSKGMQYFSLIKHFKFWPNKGLANFSIPKTQIPRLIVFLSMSDIYLD